jgi:glycosyltransferase involved in cell wall biosynthesis
VLPDVFVIDDGSNAAGREGCERLAADGLATVHRFEHNRGKGAAVMSGFRLAHERGFTHAFQIDADGQHDLAAMPTFVDAARTQPAALVAGYPIYDDSAPSTRRTARHVTRFFVDLEVGRGVIRDALIGFRVYPLAAALASGTRGARMEFDVEIAVRLASAGVPVVNLPVGVRYLARDEGGVSHFRPVRDVLRLSWMHCRVATGLSMRWCLRRLHGSRR